MTEDRVEGRVLIVDDQPGAREALRSVLSTEGFEIFEAAGGEEALSMLPDVVPDVVLLDVMMPEMDGNEVCRLIREDPEMGQTPVVMVTALDDRESKLSATWSGADDFITKPIDRDVVRARVRSIVRVNRYRTLLIERERVERLVQHSPDGILLADPSGLIVVANPAAHRMKGLALDTLADSSLWDFLELEPDDTARHALGEIVAGTRVSVSGEVRVQHAVEDRQVPLEVSAVAFPMDDHAGLQLSLRDLSERYTQLDVIRHLNEELMEAYDATLEGWVAALDLRHNETEGHTRRVTSLSVELGRAMGLSEEELLNLRRGALLHDVGKIGIPDSILLKPGPLTDEEWVVMRRHPEYAFDWLSKIEYLAPALDIPHHHHERWDGTGYPDGLAGLEIPLAARIFAPIDVFDALTSERAYRDPLTEEEALQYIEDGVGEHFDPDVVSTFMSLFASGLPRDASAEEGPSDPGPSVLVVDDDERACAAIVKALAKAGYDVEAALSGEDAIEMFERSRHQVVVTDVNLPGMDGIEVLIHLREMKPDTGIVVITGGGLVPSESLLEDASLLGAVGTLAKPFRMEELNAMVAQALDVGRPASSEPASD